MVSIDDVSYVDYIIHDYLHSNFDLETAIDKCRNNADVTELIRKLASYDAITEDEYNKTMSKMSKKHKLDRFS